MKRISSFSTTKGKKKGIIFYINHYLLVPTSFYLITMKHVFLIVWNANAFTWVVASTSHFLNELSILLKSLTVNEFGNIPYLFHISSKLLPYFLFHITLKLSERNNSTSAVLTAFTTTLQCMDLCPTFRKTALKTYNDHHIRAHNRAFSLLLFLELIAAYNRVEHFPLLKDISTFPNCQYLFILPTNSYYSLQILEFFLVPSFCFVSSLPRQPHWFSCL